MRLLILILYFTFCYISEGQKKAKTQKGKLINTLIINYSKRFNIL